MPPQLPCFFPCTVVHRACSFWKCKMNFPCLFPRFQRGIASLLVLFHALCGLTCPQFCETLFPPTCIAHVCWPKKGTSCIIQLCSRPQAFLYLLLASACLATSSFFCICPEVVRFLRPHSSTVSLGHVLPNPNPTQPIPTQQEQGMLVAPCVQTCLRQWESEGVVGLTLTPALPGSSDASSYSSAQE